MSQIAQAYRGPDRRRVGRAAEGSVGWVRAAGVVVVLATLAALGWAWKFGEVTTLPATGIGVETLRALAAVGAVVTGALLLRLASLSGRAAPRLVGTAGLLLAVAAVAELPTVLEEGDEAVLVAMRAAGVLPAVGMATAAAAWPTVDARMRHRHPLMVGAGAALTVLGVIAVALGLAPAGTAGLAVSAVMVAATAAAAGWLLVLALARRHRVLAVAGLLLLVWAAAELPLAMPVLTATTPALEVLRLLGVAVAVVAVLDCLEAAFVAQRIALLRTEQDRDTAEHELERRREWERERAHEASSALKSIDAASALLVRYHDRLDDGWQALSDGIRNEVQRLQHLVDSGSHPAEPERLDLAALVHAEGALARQAGTPVDVDVAEGCEVFAERHAVSSILHNLFDNAAKHAPGATVTVLADPPPSEGAAVELRLVDDGPGLPAGANDELFTRGAQVDGQPRSGLGLYLARSLAERGGGALWAENTAGGGAAFVLRLPGPPVHDHAGTAGARAVDHAGTAGARAVDHADHGSLSES